MTPAAKAPRGAASRTAKAGDDAVMEGPAAKTQPQLNGGLGRRLVLVGEDSWRRAVKALLEQDGRRVKIVAEFDPYADQEAVARMPQADVALVDAEPEAALGVLSLARDLQVKERGIAVVLVVESLRRDHVSMFTPYLGNWSMITRESCENRARLTTVIESAARGIAWADWVIDRRLKELQAVDSRGSKAIASYEA